MRSALKISLRLKLTLWFLAVFSVVFGGVLFGAMNLHGASNRRSLDQHLVSVALGVQGSLAENDLTLATQGLRRFQPIDRNYVILAVRDGQGNIIASRSRIEPHALPPLPDQQTALRTLEPQQAQELVSQDISCRIITHRYAMPFEQVRYMDIVSMTDMRVAQTVFLKDVFIVGALGAVVASALAAWLIAGRVVAPMRYLSDAARTIDPEHVDTRLEIDSADPEVERLQSELNNALARLEEGYRAQERFITNVAHDLKTPISVMLAKSQVLHIQSIDVEEFESYRNSMIAEMQRIGGLVESFLTLTRADQGEALSRVVDVHLNDLVVEAVAECDPDAQQREVRLVVHLTQPGSGEDEVVLRGDPDLMRTMIVNLLRNAIRFSPLGSAVDITSLKREYTIYITVRDRGPGIPEEFLESIFNRFVQVPGQNNHMIGTGLGLAIAQSVAKLHGGTISVDNCPERGCIFTVELPITAHSVTTRTEAQSTTLGG